MAISVVTRFISLPTVVKNANVNTFMCNKYPNVSRHLTTVRFSTTQSSEDEDLNFPPEEKTTAPPAVMSSHMKRYLERAKAHEDFMKKEVAEYEIGLRHLANIVGTDVKTLKQHGTDKYIEYLFPSGLYDKSARPVFKHPNELYPAKKEAEFDYSGRPHHSFFYTAKPNYYKLLHDLSHWHINLNRIEDAARRKMKTAETLENRMDYEDLLPISKTDLESIIKEELLQKEYDYFAATVQRLVEHPFSTDAKKIINTYMSQKAFSDTHIASLPVEYDENRRPFVKVTQCMRKSTRGEVIVYGDGTGNIEINGQDILYFKEQHFREQSEKSKIAEALDKGLIGSILQKIQVG